jgi:hypothetical protein
MSTSIKYKFSGHQTFAFRYGWLEKGVHALTESSTVFGEDNALVLLGVGKNMVESIRHWCMVTQMVEEDAEVKRNNGRVLRPTLIAKQLLLNGAWDPFLEDDASLWLIHWLLVSNPTTCTTWQIAFSTFQRPDFTKRELVDHLLAFADRHGLRANEGSMARDVDCFLRTYTVTKRAPKQALAEETFDCPLQELNLLDLSPDGELYRFAVGAKPSLPSAVFGFALLQYFNTAKTGRPTLGVQECLYGPGSPGQAFKLDENSLIEHVEELEKLTRGKITLDETAGMKQIFRRQEVEPASLLNSYYAKEVRK